MSSPIPIEQQPEQATQPEQAQQVEGQAAKPRRNLRKSKDQESAGIENFELPKSTVTKLAKEALPEGIKFQKDTLLAIQKSGSVFINFLASNAQEKAHDKNNKTINAQHVFAAIKEMDIGVHNNELEGLLTEELEAYKEIQTSNKASKQQQQEEKQVEQHADEFDQSVLAD